MFLVTDLTEGYPRTTKTNDSKTVRDIVVGITGSVRDGDTTYEIVSHMRFGDEYICNRAARVMCIKDQGVDTCDDKIAEFIEFYIRRRQDAFHNDSDIIEGLLEVFSKEELERYCHGNFIGDYFMG